MEQVIIGSSYGVLFEVGTGYHGLMGRCASTSTGPQAEAIIPSAGTIKKLRVELSAAPGAGKSYTFNLYKNGSAVGTLSAAIADAATSNEDSGSFSVSAGDRFGMQVVAVGTPDLVIARWTVIYEGDTANESVLLCHNGRTETGSTTYHRVMGGLRSLAAENDVRMVCPAAGTIKNLYVRLSADPGTAPDAYRFTLRKGGASQTLTVTITADNTTGNDTGNSFAVVAGDILTLMCEPLNIPGAQAYFSAGMTFVATTDGESVIMGGTENDLSNSATKYNLLCGDGFWNATEINRYQLAQASTLKDFYVLLSGSPGAGKNYVFTIRDSGGSTSTVATIADAATTGNKTDNDHALIDGDEVGLMVVPSGTPTVRDAYWGIVSFITPSVNYDINSAVIVGIVASASRTLAFDRNSSVISGIVATASRVRNRTIASAVYVGIAASASVVKGAVKSATVVVGIVASASRSLAISRASSVIVGIVASASRSRNTARASSVIVGVVAMASKVAAYIRTASVITGILVTANGWPGFIRFTLKPRVFTFVLKAREFALTLKDRAFSFTLKER